MTENQIMELPEYAERVLKAQDIKILTDNHSIEDRVKFNWEVNTESTADGYEVWYVKERHDNLDICENVYYSEYGAIEKLEELLQEESGISIYFHCENLINDIDWYMVADDLELIFEYEDESEIFELWKENVLPSVSEEFEKDGEPDRPARRESFNNYTDGLCKDGQISEEMFNDICLPDHLETTNL